MASAVIAGIAQVFGSTLVLGTSWGLIWWLDANRHDLPAPVLGSLGAALLSSVVAGAFAFRGATLSVRGLLLRWLLVSWITGTSAVMGVHLIRPDRLELESPSSESVILGAALALPIALTAASTYWLASRRIGVRSGSEETE